MGFADKCSLNIPFPSWARDTANNPSSDFENWKELQRWADRLITECIPEAVIAAETGVAYVLCMSATGSSIAPGGDQVTFDTILAQHGFTTVGTTQWTHPASGVYVLFFDLAWDLYTGGGTVRVLVDGSVIPEGIIFDGTTGKEGQGMVIYPAQKDTTGSIYVTHNDLASLTCSANLRVGISDKAIPPTPEAGWTQIYAGDVYDLTFDGSNWWTTESANAVVSKRDLSGLVLSTFTATALEGRARGLTFDGTHLYIVGARDGLFRYDRATGALVSSVDKGADAAWNGIAWDGSALWVVEDLDNQLRRYDTSGTVIVQHVVENEAWNACAMFAGDLFVMNAAQARLVRFDTSTGAQLDIIDLTDSGMASPTGVWIDEEGALYISSVGDGVYVRNAPLGV